MQVLHAWFHIIATFVLRWGACEFLLMNYGFSDVIIDWIISN